MTGRGSHDQSKADKVKEEERAILKTPSPPANLRPKHALGGFAAVPWAVSLRVNIQERKCVFTDGAWRDLWSLRIKLYEQTELGEFGGRGRCYC